MKKQGFGLSIGLILLLLKGGRALNQYMRQQEARSNTAYSLQVTPPPSFGSELTVSAPPPPATATPIKKLTYSDGDINLHYPGEWEIGETDAQYVELIGPGILLTLYWEHLDYNPDMLFDDDSATTAFLKQYIQETEQMLREMLEADSNELVSLERTERSTIGDFRIIGYAYEADVRTADTDGEFMFHVVSVPSVACESRTICFATYLRMDGPTSKSNDWQQLNDIIGSISFNNIPARNVTER